MIHLGFDILTLRTFAVILPFWHTNLSHTRIRRINLFVSFLPECLVGRMYNRHEGMAAWSVFYLKWARGPVPTFLLTGHEF